MLKVSYHLKILSNVPGVQRWGCVCCRSILFVFIFSMTPGSQDRLEALLWPSTLSVLLVREGAKACRLRSRNFAFQSLETL